MYSVEEIMTLMDKLAQTELDSVQIKDQDMSLTIKAKRPRVVEIGDVLFIIESMKLMNEVISEADGVISKICVENNSPVEYGQVIMYME